MSFVAQPATLYARELLRAAQLLRRQRVTYVGFDDRYIRGSDRATGVHVFAEIPGTNVLAYLRFGLGAVLDRQSNLSGIVTIEDLIRRLVQIA